MMHFFPILHNIWLLDHVKWSETFSNTSQIMQYLSNGLQKMKLHDVTFEQLRNDVRELLHHEFEDMFPYGPRGASMVDLADKVFSNSDSIASTQLECVNCLFSEEPEADSLASIIFGYSHDIT